MPRSAAPRPTIARLQADLVVLQAELTSVRAERDRERGYGSSIRPIVQWTDVSFILHLFPMSLGIQHWEGMQSSANGRTALRVPADVIAKKCQPYLRLGKPIYRPERILNSDFSIVADYQQSKYTTSANCGMAPGRMVG